MAGGDFDIPIMYQDLANYTMGMPQIYGGGIYGGLGNSSYLGGIRMRPQLDHDKVQLMNRKNKEGKSTFKKAMLGIGVCLLLGFIPVIRKGIKNSGGLGKYIKGLFTNTASQTVNAANSTPAKPSLWQKFKNIFKRKQAASSPPPTPSQAPPPQSP